MKFTRTSWAALGAATAVVAGAGGVGFVQAEANSSADSASSFVSNVPCRMIDTRTEADVEALGAGESVTLDARGLVGNCDIPTDATGLSVNIAAVGATSNTFLTAFPTGAERPNSSHLNAAKGVVTSNGVDVSLSADGQLDIYNDSGNVNVIIDVLGAYVPSTSGVGSAGEPGSKGDTGKTGPAGPVGPAGADATGSFRAVPVDLEVGLDYSGSSYAQYTYFGPLDVCGDDVLVDATDAATDVLGENVNAFVGVASANGDYYGSGGGILGRDGVNAGFFVDGPMPEGGWPLVESMTAMVGCGSEIAAEGALDGVADNNLADAYELEDGPRIAASAMEAFGSE